MTGVDHRYGTSQAGYRNHSTCFHTRLRVPYREFLSDCLGNIRLLLRFVKHTKNHDVTGLNLALLNKPAILIQEVLGASLSYTICTCVNYKG